MSLARAIETRNLTELPSRRNEDWRWSDMRGLVRVLPPASPPGDAAQIGAGRFDALADERIVVLNGRRLDGRGAVLVDPGQVRIIALRSIAQAPGTAHQWSLSLTVEAGARLALLESHEGPGPSYLASAAIDIQLGEGASLERIVLIEHAADAVAVVDAAVRMAANARFSQTVLTSGAMRQRCETRVTHPGAGAAVRIDGLYLLAGARHADLTSEVRHQGPGGITAQLTKGAVRDQSRGVFQGRIVVEPGADQTDARMGHHALILSERAEVDAKPELLIHADDVSCAHGNTVGALDENVLFYLRQRGLPEAEARAVLTEAFVGEVVDRIEHEGAREIARAWVAAHLRGGE